MNIGQYSHTTPDLRWLGNREYLFQDTPHNRRFHYISSRGHYVRPCCPFVFDMASVPWVYIRTFPRDEFAPCALLHDFMVNYATLFPGGSPCTCDDANWIFFDSIRTLCKTDERYKYRLWKAYPQYLGVTLGCWWTWNSHNDGRKKCFPYFPRSK